MKSKKKDKKFYNDIKRNQQWTEEEHGREIDFADKYIYNAHYSDKYDYKRPDKIEAIKKKAKEQKKKRTKKFFSVVLAIVVICIGYTGMDVYTTRHSRPVELLQKSETSETGNMSQVSLNISSYYVESVSLDSSVMLSSLISETIDSGYSGITFDAKREDGTIGYASSLASVDTYGAISAPAVQPKASVKELLANDLLPIARICCYKDNTTPIKANDCAIKVNNKIYTDKDDNTYLNPNSEAAYNYIKDIVQECYEFGINIFVLHGCDLPEEITDSYNDGFSALVSKLEKDLGTNIKFIEEIDVEINGKDSETGKTTNNAIKKDIQNLEEINKDQTYFISTKINDKKLIDQLTKNNVQSFIIDLK